MVYVLVFNALSVFITWGLTSFDKVESLNSML